MSFSSSPFELLWIYFQFKFKFQTLFLFLLFFISHFFGERECKCVFVIFFSFCSDERYAIANIYLLTPNWWLRLAHAYTQTHTHTRIHIKCKMNIDFQCIEEKKFVIFLRYTSNMNNDYAFLNEKRHIMRYVPNACMYLCEYKCVCVKLRWKLLRRKKPNIWMQNDKKIVYNHMGKYATRARLPFFKLQI